MKRLMLLLFSLIGLLQTANGDLSGAIGQLEKNDIATAKEVIKALDQISMDNANPESKPAASLSGAIKRTFVAEFNLQQASQKIGDDSKRADELDQQGRDHLKPNALGAINQIGADTKFKAARETRSNALKIVTDRSSELEITLNSLSTEAVKAKLSKQDQGILKTAADSIRKRTLEPAGKAVQEMLQHVKSESNRIAAEDAELAESQDLQDASKNRDSALRAMQRAIRTGDKTDEARAMKLLMKYAPESVDGFNDNLAAKAARAAAARQAALENKVRELESKVE
ncbi:MAG: hypothetical protein V4819_21460 [Verrucomicrobiota bacterium]